MKHASFIDTAMQLTFRENGRVADAAEIQVTPGYAAAMTPAQAGAIRMAGLFGALWTKDGRPVYQLNHSIAALLATTKSEPLQWDRLPLRTFVIDVPHDFCPVFCDHPRQVPARVLIAVSSVGYVPDLGGIFGTVCGDNLCVFGKTRGDEGSGSTVRDPMATSRKDQLDRKDHAIKIAMRLASNTITFITEYKDCVNRAPGGAHGPSNVQIVSTPRDIVVDRSFRDLAKDLVGSRTFAGTKRALSHLVRGHWRSQAVGTGRQERRLTWVRPHRRGDEALGQVVARTHRLVTQ